MSSINLDGAKEIWTPEPHTYHAAAKSPTNTGNCRFYDIFLTWLKADIRAEFSKDTEVSKMIDINRI